MKRYETPVINVAIFKQDESIMKLSYASPATLSEDKIAGLDITTLNN